MAAKSGLDQAFERARNGGHGIEPNVRDSTGKAIPKPAARDSTPTGMSQKEFRQSFKIRDEIERKKEENRALRRRAAFDKRYLGG